MSLSAGNTGRRSRGGEECEGFDVTRSHDREMAVVECGHLSDAQAFGDGNNRRIGTAEAEVGVLIGQVGCPPEVR